MTLQRRFRIFGRPGVPLDHHAWKPSDGLPFARAGDRTPSDGPTRIRLLIHPRGIEVTQVYSERRRPDRVALGFGCIGRRRPSLAVPENNDLFAAERWLSQLRVLHRTI